MNHNDHLHVTFSFKHESDNFSLIESKLDQINHSSSLKTPCNTSNNPYPFDLNSCELNLDHNSLTLETKTFDVNIKCSNIIKICDLCCIALYGRVYSNDILNSKLCSNTFNQNLNLLSKISGSFSLVYVSLHNGYIYSLKDEFGSKSLLISFSPSLTISNVALNTQIKWLELPPYLFFIIGESPFLYERNNCILNELGSITNVNYKSLEYNLVLSVLDTLTTALVESVLESCEQRKVKECVTILFSGGLDSSLISVVAMHKLKDVYFELINVSFDPEYSPDRITCLFTYEELINIFPNLDIRLVLIDVDPEEYSRDEMEIFRLSFPNQTHMDLNISASLYYSGTLKGYLLSKDFFKTDFWIQFKSNTSVLKSINFKVTVSKERKSCKNNDLESDDVNYTSTPPLQMYKELSMNSQSNQVYLSKSKDVIIGSGADELFGGYGRHVSAKIFDEERSFGEEITKLWKRNLGRDDRVLNFRNISGLYPFLNRSLINCLSNLPFNPSIILDYLDPPDWFKEFNIYKGIEPDLLLNSEFLNSTSRSVSIHVNKWILREICHRFGLRNCCNFKKRAMQFGTKSAKVFNKIHNMSNRQASNKGSATFCPNYNE